MSNRTLLLLMVGFFLLGFFFTCNRNVEFYRGKMYTNHKELVIDSVRIEGLRMIDSARLNMNIAIELVESDSLEDLKKAQYHGKRALDYADSADALAKEFEKLNK